MKTAVRPARGQRLLLLGPVFTSGEIGGLQIVLGDLAGQLAAHGWRVDALVSAAEPSAVAPSATAPSAAAAPAAAPLIADWASTAALTRDSLLDRRPRFYAGWMRFIPASWREMISLALKPPAYFETLSHNLRVAESLLPEARRYDAVLLCLNGAAPGLAALIADRLDRVVILSLNGLSDELKPSPNRLGLWKARRLAPQAHPYLYRPIAPEQVRLAIFASAQWQADAVGAGWPAERARTIYFGVPLAPPQLRPAVAGHRILAVGRLSPDKGMHYLVRAMPAIRRRVCDATLDIIAGPGPTGYRQWLLRLIRANGLEDVVRLLPSADRVALRAAYAGHDVLYFYSKFAEPVALVLMEAFAAGLPVAASQVRTDAPLIRDGVTCLTYDPYHTRSLAQVMVRLLSEPALGQGLAATAQSLVRQEFSLEKMGRAYDETLREFLALPAASDPALATVAR